MSACFSFTIITSVATIPARARTIYLVDKPSAAQSVFQLGHPGPTRYTPDYYALQVMNTLLGGLFQSRLNHNIREEKGYSYGVGSGFSYGRGPGAFNAGGGIVTAKTDSALIEFMKEIRGVQGAIPFFLLHAATLAVFWVGASPVAVWTCVALYVLRMFAQALRADREIKDGRIY